MKASHSETEGKKQVISLKKLWTISWFDIPLKLTFLGPVLILFSSFDSPQVVVNFCFFLWSPLVPSTKEPSSPASYWHRRDSTLRRRQH